MKVCYVLSYFAPNYIRTRSILRALRETAGIEVFEAINNNINAWRYSDTLQEAYRIKKEFAPDAYILGFRGHEIYWPLRHLVGERPIIVDALMSPYASLINEKKFGNLGKAGAKAWRHIEQSILNDANLVLTDTVSHVEFYQDEFGVPPERLLAIPVGAEERGPKAKAMSNPNNDDTKQSMTALFYGSFLPLHGIDVILSAASKLRELPINFHFIGGNNRKSRHLIASCEKMGITRYTHQAWVDFDELINTLIPRADICLGGPFGNTDQARRVITGKTSQCLALGRPTIIGETNEKTGFVDKENCLLIPQGNPEALSGALRWAYDHRTKLATLGEQGRAIYEERLSIRVIRDLLGKAIFDLMSHR